MRVKLGEKNKYRNHGGSCACAGSWNPIYAHAHDLETRHFCAPYLAHAHNTNFRLFAHAHKTEK